MSKLLSFDLAEDGDKLSSRLPLKSSRVYCAIHHFGCQSKVSESSLNVQNKGSKGLPVTCPDLLASAQCLYMGVGHRASTLEGYLHFQHLVPVEEK